VKGYCKRYLTEMQKEVEKFNLQRRQISALDSLRYHSRNFRPKQKVPHHLTTLLFLLLGLSSLLPLLLLSVSILIIVLLSRCCYRVRC